MCSPKYHSTEKCVVWNKFFLYKDVHTVYGTSGKWMCKHAHVLIQMQNRQLCAHLSTCRKKITHCTWAFPCLTCPLAICFSPWLQTSVYWWFLKHQRTEKGVTVNKKKFSMFLMSFSLVYCSFSKSCLRIRSCQISSPKIHTVASNALRTPF